MPVSTVDGLITDVFLLVWKLSIHEGFKLSKHVGSLMKFFNSNISRRSFVFLLEYGIVKCYNTKSGNYLKRSLADSVEKLCFRRHTDKNNSPSHPHRNWISTLWCGYSTMHSLLRYHQSTGRVCVWDSLGVWDRTLALKKHRAMPNIKFSLLKIPNRRK